MSHHIVQKIEIDKEEEKVFITGCDNNVSPRTPYRWHCSYYDSMMKNKQYQEIERDILNTYERGSFQAGRKNKYTRALIALRRMEKYKDFSWQLNWDNYEKNQNERSKEWTEMLDTAFKVRLPKPQYAITKESMLYKKTVYLHYRKGDDYASWSPLIDKATLHRFKDEAEEIKNLFPASTSHKLKVVKIK